MRVVHHHILPRPNLQGPLEVPSIHLPGTGIRIPSPPLQSLPIAQSHYPGRGGRLGTTSKETPEDITLPRRLICRSSRQQIAQDTESELTHIQTLGFRVNLKKSDLSPRQVVFFLGIHLDYVSRSYWG